jgi:glycosyltransferase involved in cell wall biosynthesis
VQKQEEARAEFQIASLEYQFSTQQEASHVNPLTVITPSYNQARFVRRTIESVLSQDVPGLQYLVFDGDSTDSTPDILREYAGRLTAVIERDAGQADAVNKGLARSSGAVIGWLNSDDVYYPGACAGVLDFFERHPEVDVVYGEADHIDDEDRVIEPYYTEPFSYARLKDVCFLCQPAVFFRRSVVDRYGPLQAGLRYCLDYEYWLRILAERPPYFLRTKLAGSRLHAETKTLSSKEAFHREILEMLAAKFGRPPSRWVHNLAHVIVRERGLTRDTPEQDRRFVAAVVDVTEEAFQQYCGGVPTEERQTLAAWRQFAGEAARR